MLNNLILDILTKLTNREYVYLEYAEQYWYYGVYPEPVRNNKFFVNNGIIDFDDFDLTYDNIKRFVGGGERIISKDEYLLGTIK